MSFWDWLMGKDNPPAVATPSDGYEARGMPERILHDFYRSRLTFPPMSVLLQMMLCLRAFDEHPYLEQILYITFSRLFDHIPQEYMQSKEELLAEKKVWDETDTRDTTGPSVPLHDVIKRDAFTDLGMFIIHDKQLVEHGLASDVRKQLQENIAQQNGLSRMDLRTKRVPLPHERDDDPHTLAFTTYKDTPFLEVLNARVPFTIARDRWPTHAVIIAPSEWGKSELTGVFLREAIEDADQRAVILCDPHGDLYNKALPRVPPERLVAIDLTKNPPDLNILDHSVMSERAALETFRFLMSSLAGGLSPKQETCIKPLFALLGKVRDANLMTLHDIITEQAKRPTKFAAEIAQLDPLHRTFFENLWYTGNFQETRDALMWKVGAALDDATFRKMFTAKRNALDVSRWIEERKIVLIKSGDQLDKEGTRLFFLFLVGQYYAAAKRRDAIPESQRHLAMMFVDEASVVLSSKIISDVLVEIRKYRCAFIAATQLWQHIAQEVRPAVLGSTGIRLLGQLGHDEASALYRDMKVPLETITGLKNVPRSHAQWCVYVRSVTEKGVVIQAPYGVLEGMPTQKTAPIPERSSTPIREQNLQPLPRTENRDTTTLPRTHEGPSKPEPPRTVASVPPEGDKGSVPLRDDDDVHTKPNPD